MKKDKNGKSVSKSMKKADNGICSDCNYNIKEETVDKKKVKEKDVFEKGKKKVPKGSHRMPDGSIMKDKDMKSTPRQKKKTRRPKNQKY